jgi:hypothetical protein
MEQDVSKPWISLGIQVLREFPLDMGLLELSLVGFVFLGPGLDCRFAELKEDPFPVGFACREPGRIPARNLSSAFAWELRNIIEVPRGFNSGKADEASNFS